MEERFSGTPVKGAMHVVLDLLGCEPDHLIGWKSSNDEIKAIIVAAGMTVATDLVTGAPCELGHDYPGEGSGYTYTVYVLESHVIIHTTPESSLVNVCVFFCNFRDDNAAKAIAVAGALKSFFGAKLTSETPVRRFS